MEFTGERYMTTEGGVMAYEHWHRYAHVARWVQGKRVLDAACGEGYGSAFLARSAKSVLGVDIDADAVKYATGLYGDVANVAYRQTDILDLNPEDEQFEVIVSFETLEHVPDPEALMDAFQRLLAPGGVLIISTPDKDVYSGKYGHNNAFHIRELTADEFEATCKARFKNVRILGQKGYVASVIGDRTAAGGKVDLFGGSPEGPVAGVPSVVEALYLIAFCSDAKIQPDPGPTTFFIDNDASVQDERSVIEGWAQSLNRELEDLKTSSGQERDRTTQLVDGLERALKTSQSAIGKYEADNSRLDGLADRLERIEQQMSGGGADAIERVLSQLTERVSRTEALMTGQAEALANSLAALADRLQESEARTVAAIADRSGADAALISATGDRILAEQARAQQAHQGRLSRLAQDMATVSNAVDQDRVYFGSLLNGLQRTIETLSAPPPAEPVKASAAADRTAAADSHDARPEQVTTNQSEASASLRTLRKDGAEASDFWRKAVERHEGPSRLFRKKKAKPDRDRLAGLVLKSGLLAPEWYSAQVGRPLSDPDAVWHFVTEGVAQNLSPHPLFDPQWYLTNNYDVDIAEIPAFLHYLEHGWRENRAPNPLFDPEFYRLQTAVAEEPLAHFLGQAGNESDPHADFGVGDYRRQRPDLAAADINPLTHYIQQGRAEGLSTFRSPIADHF